MKNPMKGREQPSVCALSSTDLSGNVLQTIITSKEDAQFIFLKEVVTMGFQKLVGGGVPRSVHDYLINVFSI